MADKESTLVVKIRVSDMAHEAVTEAARTNYRTFQDQTRLVLDEWAANYINKREGRVAVVLKTHVAAVGKIY